MEHYIFQNNAVNIYENYFEDLPPAPLVEQSTSRTVNVYRDPCQYKVTKSYYYLYSFQHLITFIFRDQLPTYHGHLMVAQK